MAKFLKFHLVDYQDMKIITYLSGFQSSVRDPSEGQQTSKNGHQILKGRKFSL